MEQATVKMVRCLVCGAVFPADVELCPVCGVGSENFEPLETEDEPAFLRDTDERFLILGGGPAAVQAAAAIRARNESCDICMLCGEDALPYNRPMLTKNLLKGLERDAFAIHERSWYEKRNIRLQTGKRAVSLDAVARTVQTADGARYPYDKCVYALGARCFVPPFPGVELPEVVSIRSLADVLRIGELLPRARHAVVIGGGVLGLEAASELRKTGMGVAVVETADRLLHRQLDAESSAFLQKLVTAKGIRLALGAAVERICGQEHAESVTLKDGSFLAADLVVVSTGVRANAELARDANLAVGRAVTVNEHMETSAPDLYACGDCAEYLGVNYSIWPEASAMGECAGANAAGEPLSYQNPLPALTLNAMDTSLYAVGDIGKDPGKTYEHIARYAPDGLSMASYYLCEGKLVGGILMGDSSDMQLLAHAVIDGVPYAGLFTR